MPSQAIIGYRGWRIDEDDKLVPPHRPRRNWPGAAGDPGSPWKPRGFAYAICDKQKLSPELIGGAPAHANCGCGLYGHFSYPRAKLQEERTASVLGAFIGFGSVALHTYGFRAGKGRIIGLLAPQPMTLPGTVKIAQRSRRDAERAAALYEVPLFDKPEELIEEAQRWGVERDCPVEEGGLRGAREAGENMGMSLTQAMQGMAQPWSGHLSSGYRKVGQQAALAALAMGSLGKTRRVVVTATLKDGTTVTRTERPGGGYKIGIEGLSDHWTIAGGKIERASEVIEMPAMPILEGGEYPMVSALAQERQVYTVELEATLPHKMIGPAIDELKAIAWRVEMRPLL